MAKDIPVNPLAIIIDLEKRARNALTIEELGFVVVNETHKIVSYRQAIMFDELGNIISISGTSSFDENSPFIYWLIKNFSPLSKKIEDPQEINSKNYEKFTDADWSEWLPNFGYFVPLKSPVNGQMGMLFVSRDSNWTNDEHRLLRIIADVYGHCWGALKKPNMIPRIKNRNALIKISLLIGLFLLIFLPVPLSVLAPSEIVAVNPSIIRAPVAGVVEKILVKPNQVVKKGDALFLLDSLVQRNELKIAKKILSSLKLQYAQLARQALSDVNSKKFLAKTLGGLKEQEIRIKNLEQLIESMRVPAPISGTVIINDPDAWEGRPVDLGEKIVSVADEKLVEVESWLSVSDVIDLQKGAFVRVYLNSDPLNSIRARVQTFSYEAQQRPGDVFAHRIRSRILDKSVTPRLGLRGTAKIIGENAPMIYWIFRRPISALRQFIGF